MLNNFHPDLRAMLNKKKEVPSDLVEQIEGDGITAPCLPKLRPMKWGQEYAGYTITVDYGMGGDSNIVLGD